VSLTEPAAAEEQQQQREEADGGGKRKTQVEEHMEAANSTFHRQMCAQ
jgi:hypothetical protein